MAPGRRRLAAAFLSLLLLGGASAAYGQDEDQAVYLEAENIIHRGDGDSYIASGSVVARQGERSVYADELEYWPESGRVVARGNVRMFGQGPYAQTADEVELDEALAEGVAFGFTTVMENQGRAAAATAVRRANGSIELNDAYYTACPICEDGEEDPTWRMRADRVVRDTEDQMIYYENAQLEVMGVPVFYAPVFAHADPSSERRSGLLFPSFGYSSRLGAFYGQPYYWSISPYSDLTVAPRAMTNVRPIVELEYRKRFYRGEMEFEGSLGYDREIDSSGDRFGDEDFRWHLFGGGEFELRENWVAGFGIQRTSDKLHLRTYDISEQADDLGAPLRPEGRRLVSQLYVENNEENRWITAIAADFQTLRDNEDDDDLPGVPAIVEFRQILDGPAGWGRLEIEADGAVLTRSTDLDDIYGLSRGIDRGFTGQEFTNADAATRELLLSGADEIFGEAMNLGEPTDYARASIGANWRARHVTENGFVIEPFAEGRSDFYAFGDIPILTGQHFLDDTGRRDISNLGMTDVDVNRTVGLAGTEFSYPFYRPGENVDWIVEPVVQGVWASDDPLRDETIESDTLNRFLRFNEDSQSLDVDSSVLLRTNRSPGRDVWEEGARVTYGMRASAEWRSEDALGYARSASLFVGQSQRLDGEPAFNPASGLFRDESDYIVAGQVDLGQFQAYTSSRFSSEDGSLNRIDAEASYTSERFEASARYISFSDDLSDRPGPQSELIAQASYQLTEHWSVIGGLQRDLDLDINRRAQAGFAYGDDCTQMEIVYYREDFGGNIGDSESIRVRITLFTLGTADGS
jgi:LPS-assembly protein